MEKLNECVSVKVKVNIPTDTRVYGHRITGPVMLQDTSIFNGGTD
jgi:hypothetical protein